MPAPSNLHESLQALPYIDQQVRMFDLEQPRFAGMPIHPAHQPGYSYFLYRRHSDNYRPEELGVRNSASGVIVCMEHSGTHIDAICHQSDAQRLYGGSLAVDVCNQKGFTEHAIEEVQPMFAPGVLLDAAAAKTLVANGCTLVAEGANMPTTPGGVRVFQQAGIALPHSSQALASGGVPVSRDQLQPGDVVTLGISGMGEQRQVCVGHTGK